MRLEFVSRRLRTDNTLQGLSSYQRGTLAELKLIGRDLYADIRRRGVILPDGEVNPAVEAHRKNAHEQLYSLSVYTELNKAHRAESFDLVSAISDAEATAIIDAAAGSKSAGESQGESPAVEQSAASEPESER